MTAQWGGKIYHGAFMERAMGVELNDFASLGKSKLKKIVKNPNACSEIGLKNVADLQVCDNIAGQVDRHEYNMLYNYNEDDEFSAEKLTSKM